MSELTLWGRFLNWLFSKSFWCKLGCHRWTWTLGSIGFGYDIPPHAKCERCGETYKQQLTDKGSE